MLIDTVNKRWVGGGLILLLFIVAASMQLSYETASTTKYNITFLVLSESCQRMIDNNITSDCPTLKELIPFDTSNQKVSGMFVNDTNGHVIRTHPQLKNNWMFYQYFNHNVVCVACEFNYASPDLAHIVIIEPKSFQWVNKDPSIMVSNHTVTIFNGRYVTPDCLSATLAYDYNLMADTIYYINSGCTKTSYVGNYTLSTPDTPVNRTSSLQYHYQSFVQDVKKNGSKIDCIRHTCDNPKNVFSNPGY